MTDMRMKRKSLKVFPWLLTLALILLAGSAGASWQCQNGAVCPPEHFRSLGSAQRASTKLSNTHLCCMARLSAVVHSIGGNGRFVTGGSGCVLRVHTTPPSRLLAAPFSFAPDFELWTTSREAPNLLKPSNTAQPAVFVPPYPLQTGPPLSISARAPPVSV